MRKLTIAIVLTLSLFALRGAAGREWTDMSGKFRLDAEFVSVKDGKVVLEKADGSYVGIPLERLSKADQDFVKAKTADKEKSDNPFEDLPGAKVGAVTPAASPGVAKLRGKTDDGKPGEVRRFRDQGWGIKSLAFSPSGAMLAAGKPDRALQLYDVVEESRLDFADKLETLGGVAQCCFTADGKKLLASGDSGLILIWDVTKEGRLKPAGQFAGHAKQIDCICTSADGKRALSGGHDKRLRYWSVDDGKEIATFDGFEGHVKAAILSPDGNFAFATDGALIVAIDLAKQEVVKRSKLTSSWAAGQFAAFSPDGSHVAAGDGYNVRLWEMKSGKELPKLEDREIQWSGAFTPDGTRLITGGSGKINVWNIKNQRRLSALATAGTGYIQTLAVSPDNSHVAAIPSSAGQDLVVLRIPDAGQ